MNWPSVGVVIPTRNRPELVRKAIAAVRVLEPVDQDRIAEAMLTLAEGSEPEDIDPEHLPDILRGLAEAERGDIRHR